MTSEFQSLYRNVDLGNRVSFKNYLFTTDDDKVAAFVRRNCKANPREYWEVTKVLKEAAETDAEVKETLERPKRVLKTNAGFRSSDMAEGASV